MLDLCGLEFEGLEIGHWKCWTWKIKVRITTSEWMLHVQASLEFLRDISRFVLHVRTSLLACVETTRFADRD